MKKITLLLALLAAVCSTAPARSGSTRPMRPRLVSTKPGGACSEGDFIQALDTHKTSLCQNGAWVDGAVANASGDISAAHDLIAGNNVWAKGQKLCLTSTCDRYVAAGAGSPEGAATASVGSLWLRTDGGTDTTLYRKESGTGNTGWVASAAGGGGGGAAPSIMTGTSSNTDTLGVLTTSGFAHTASYTFTGSYSVAPVCVFQDISGNTYSAPELIVSSLTTTGFTITTSGNLTFNWICGIRR